MPNGSGLNIVAQEDRRILVATIFAVANARVGRTTALLPGRQLCIASVAVAKYFGKNEEYESPSEQFLH